MQFKDFITRQRVTILVVGIGLFTICLVVARLHGFATLTGELLVDLAASAVTVVFTALVIDYLGIREQSNKTKNAAGLAEDEIRATCFRIKGRMARLFGLERNETSIRDSISNRSEAQRYLNTVRQDVNQYLASHSLLDEKTPIVSDLLPRYIERLEIGRTELEQTLLLYEYAMSYSLREKVLSLRSELQIADNLIGFIDTSDDLNEANLSLIRILSTSVYEQIEEVLEHDSQIDLGVPLHAKDSRLV